MKEKYYIVNVEIVAQWNRFSNGIVAIEFRKNNYNKWVINIDSGIQELMDCSQFTIIELDYTDFPLLEDVIK